MATKEDHRSRLDREEERACREFAGERIDNLLEDLAEALAERDEAKQDSAKTLEEHLRVVAERDALRTTCDATQRELAALREKTSDERRDALECKVREALGHGLPFPEYTDEQVAGFVREVVDELRALKSAPRPKPAPVVGGATDAHIEAILSCSRPANASRTFQYIQAFEEARAAIRAQKRVDVEAIRSLAMTYPPDGFIRPELLSALGDEPSEAPASAPQAEPETWQHGETGRTVEMAESPGPRWQKVAPPAPAEAEGPYSVDVTDIATFLHENGRTCQIHDTQVACRLARLANLGWKAEQGLLVKPPADKDRWSDLDRAWAMNAKAHLQALADIFGHDEDVTFDQALEDVRRRLSLKPPETREEMLCEFLRLAIELGDEKPIVFDQVCACPATAWEERETVLRPFVRAHLDAKRKAAESAKGGAK